MATQIRSPAKAVKLLVGPTYKIPLSTLRRSCSSSCPANQRYAQESVVFLLRRGAPFFWGGGNHGGFGSRIRSWVTLGQWSSSAPQQLTRHPVEPSPKPFDGQQLSKRTPTYPEQTPGIPKAPNERNSFINCWLGGSGVCSRGMLENS